MDQMINESGGDMGQPGGYCIEIYVGQDGSMSVSSEQKAPEEGKSGAQVSSIEEAIERVIDIYENNGDSADDDSDFDEGFNGGPTMREGE